MSSGSISVNSLIGKSSGEKKVKGESRDRERDLGRGIVRSASVGAVSGLPGTPGSMDASGSVTGASNRGAMSDSGGPAHRTRANVDLSSSIPEGNVQSTSSSKHRTTSTGSGNAPRTPPGAMDISSTGLLSLLGPSVTSFPFSEEAYIETIKLRSEQEKTKQDFYRLEIANKNLAILQNALRSQIPVNLIPLMCVGNLPPELEQKQQQQAQKPQQPQQQTQPQPQQTQQPQSQPQSLSSHSRSSSSRSSLTQPDSLNASAIPPMNYRFGGGSSAPGPGAGRRPLSPAKIGAAAVANLATPTTPYRNMSSSRRSLRSHQRHYSMPVESHARGVNLNLAEAQSKPKPPMNQGQHTPMGSTSTLQVKPSPAQPLHKQNKLNQPPSQESMTSFQHIIQFHHWKPDEPQGPGMGGGNPFRTPSQGPLHKRHKSDNMSIDLNSDTLIASGDVVSPRIGMKPMAANKIVIHEDDDDDEARDMTMNTSTISDATNSPEASKIMPRDDPDRPPIDGGHIRTLLNVGRYPHDILAPY